MPKAMGYGGPAWGEMMLKKILENLLTIHAAVTALTGLIAAGTGAWAAMHFSDKKLEDRVAALEKYVAKSGPPATFWEQRCAKLIDDYAGADGSLQEGRIDRAMDKIGCKQ